MRITQVSSGLMATHTLTSVPAVAPCANAGSKPNGTSKPSARPPMAAEPTTNVRRDSFAALPRMMLFTACLRSSLRGVVGGHVHGRSDALIGAAATDIGHRFVDVLVGRLRSSLEQSRGGHDLAGLAIAALRHVDRRPGLLHGMRGVGGQSLDGDDAVGRLHVANPNGAGALHLVIDVHGAGAALRDATAVFRAGETELLAEHPQQRGLGLHLHVAIYAIDVELCHELPLAKSLRRV